MPNVGTSALISSRAFVDRVVEHRRIARAVAEEHAVRTGRQQLGRRRGRRKHAHVAAVRGEAPQDVPLHAEVVGGDPQRPPGAPLRRRRELVRRRPASSRTARSQVTPTHQIRSFHRRQRPRLLDQLARIELAGGDDAAHHAARAQHARQRARVDVGDGDDVVADEVVAQRAVARQLLAIGDSSRTMKPATCGARDSASSGAMP